MRWVLTVDPVDNPRSETSPKRTPKREWKVASLALVVASAVLVVAVLVANLQSPRVALALLISLIAAMIIFALVSADVIRQMRRRERQVRTVFEDREQEFRQMAENIQEIFWVIDPETRTATYVNPAYEATTGRSCQSLIEEPSSYEQAIHPDDRAHVLGKLKQAAQSGHFEERFRIVRPTGEIRWVWVRGFPRKDANGKIIRLGGTALDITALKPKTRSQPILLRRTRHGLKKRRCARQLSPLPKTCTWTAFWMRCSALWPSWFPTPVLGFSCPKAVPTGWRWEKDHAPNLRESRLATCSHSLRMNRPFFNASGRIKSAY